MQCLYVTIINLKDSINCEIIIPTEAILHVIDIIPKGLDINTFISPDPFFNKSSAVDAISLLYNGLDINIIQRNKITYLIKL